MNIVVCLSAIIWGFGCFVHKQFVRGILFLLTEILIIRHLIVNGFNNLKLLVTLGELEQQKIWDEAKSVFVYIDGDRSLVILLYGIITIAICGLGILILTKSVQNARENEKLKQEGKPIPDFKTDIAQLFDNNLHITLMTLPVAGVVVFTILPLIFMMCMAFTDYSIIDNKLVLFNWVGLKNFKSMLSFKEGMGSSFWSVLTWTICWAILATFSNYFLGMLLALLINWREVRCKKFWRL
jgi:arabinogalactan oligomer/maltooligosaccharide transport system permease protein